MKSPIILRIFKNNQLLEVKQFEQDQIIFGHEADVTVDLDDESISAIHSLIELRDSGYYICDMGSSSGTNKNGKPILDEPISSGDHIEMGPYRIQFFVGAPKPKAAPATKLEPPQAESSHPAQEVMEPVATPRPVVPPVPPVPRSTPVPPASPVPAASPVPPAPPASGIQSVKASIPAAGSAAAISRPPKISSTSSGSSAHLGKKKKHSSTFAPPSEIKDLKTYLKSTKGPVVEVIIAWKERVLETHHFGSDRNVTIGSSPNADISIPSSFVKGAIPFIEIKGGCKILAPSSLEVELVNSNHDELSLEDLLKSGKALKASAGHAIRLDQGELLALSVPGNGLRIFVRYVANTVRPLLGSPLDFSASELTGIVAAMVIVALTALYMSVYTPEIVEEKEEEEVRLAQFIYNKPPTTTLPSTPTPTTMPPPKEVVKVPPPPPQPPKKVAIDMEKPKKIAQGKQESKTAVKQLEAAKAAEVRPNPSQLNRPKKFTSVKQGGATKIGNTAGANAQSAKDVTKVGLLSAFGGGGVRKQLDRAYSGSGELLGMANEATGRSGQNENRAGDDIGSKFKDTGAGGKGTATQGIAGIGTKGRGSGMSAYGAGMGLGGKGNVTIDAGGVEEGWEGTIDREAVRRVIKSILNQIKSCYERQLRVNSGLEGKVVIQFEIMEQGRVRSAKTRSTTLNDNTVESCVASRIREARFPEPPTGTIAVVDYPFVFGAQK